MKVFTVKLILSRSNPQQIRELQIEEDRTIAELQQAVAAVFLDHPGECKSITFRTDEHSVSPSLALKDVLDVDSFAQIDLNLRKDPSCNLLLEVLESGDVSDFYVPHITRFRPDLDPSSATGYFLEDAEKNNQLLLEKMNRSLVRLFRPGSIAPEFCKTISIPLSRILESHTVTDLKQFADRFQLDYYSGQRKADLIRTLCCDMNQDRYWTSLLSSLTYTEYQAMNTLCVTGNLPDPSVDFWDVLPKLSERSLLAHDYSGVTRIAKEFMDFYERWLENNNERDFLLNLCYRTVLTAACKLYGFVDRELAEELFLHCYPEVCQNTNLSELWDAGTAALTLNLKKLNVSTRYNLKDFDRSAAEELQSNFVLRNRLHYTPDRYVLEKVAVYGYQLDPEMGNEYRRLLLKYHCSSYLISYSAAEIAHLTYFVYSHDEILRFCANTLRLKSTSPVIKAISDFLTKHKKDFRLLPLSGLTEAEFDAHKKQPPKKVAAVAKKRIYPNDPCPCGSGKKYKVCCGRKS